MFDASAGTFAANKVMRELRKSGAAGYTEPAVKLTLTQEEANERVREVDDGHYVAEVSNTWMDLHKITKLALRVDPDTAAATGMPEYMEIAEGFSVLGEEKVQMLVVNEQVAISIRDFDNNFESVAVACQLDENGKVVAWFTDIQFGEDVVHPIDPKYLPKGGVGYSETKVLLDGVFTTNESGFIPTNLTDIKVGDTVTVNWNGVEYTCVARAYNEEGITATVFGNTTAGGGVDNGVPFIHVSGLNEGTLTAKFLTGSIGESISIKVTTETIHPIDPKYLPGVVLPVVELHPELKDADDGTFDIPTEEGEKLSAVASQRIPVVFSLSLLGDEICTTAIWQRDTESLFGGRYVLNLSMGGTLLVLTISGNSEDESQWGIRMETFQFGD